MCKKTYLCYTKEEILKHLEDCKNLTTEEIITKYDTDLIVASLGYLQATCHRVHIKRNKD